LPRRPCGSQGDPNGTGVSPIQQWGSRTPVHSFMLGPFQIALPQKPEPPSGLTVILNRTTGRAQRSGRTQPKPRTPRPSKRGPRALPHSAQPNPFQLRRSRKRGEVYAHYLARDLPYRRNPKSWAERTHNWLDLTASLCPLRATRRYPTPNHQTGGARGCGTLRVGGPSIRLRDVTTFDLGAPSCHRTLSVRCDLTRLDR
jgi:hypothetical protein